MQKTRSKHLKILFVVLAAVLSSCGNPPPDFPDVDYGTPIKRSPLKDSYFYFVSVKEESDRSYYMGLNTFMDSDMLCMSIDDYAKVEKWAIDKSKSCEK